jgi:hypothetical protein
MAELLDHDHQSYESRRIIRPRPGLELRTAARERLLWANDGGAGPATGCLRLCALTQEPIGRFWPPAAVPLNVHIGSSWAGFRSLQAGGVRGQLRSGFRTFTGLEGLSQEAGKPGKPVPLDGGKHLPAHCGKNGGIVPRRLGHHMAHRLMLGLQATVRVRWNGGRRHRLTHGLQRPRALRPFTRHRTTNASRGQRR